MKNVTILHIKISFLQPIKSLHIVKAGFRNEACQIARLVKPLCIFRCKNIHEYKQVNVYGSFKN